MTTASSKGTKTGLPDEKNYKNILFLVGPLMKHLQDQTGRGALPRPS